MIRDADAGLPHDPISCDICVVGSGPAGISLALKLARGGLRTVLLEAGGLEADGRSADQYAGDIVGMDYHPLDAARLRHLGGSSGHWTGRCMMFDPEDFLPHPDVPLSGWPIRHDDLAPFRAEAARLFNIADFGALRRQADRRSTIEVVAERFSSDRRFYELKNNEPVRFGHVFREEMEAERNLDVIVNANLTELEPDPATGRIRSATFRTYGGSAHSVLARDYVLAMGGIENARQLLLLNAAHDGRIGNQGGMVGRCFMEHPLVHHGGYFITRRLYSHSEWWEADRLFRRTVPELPLAVPQAQARAEGRLGGALYLDRLRRRPLELRDDEPPFVRDMTFDRDYFFTGHCWSTTEQAPNPASRVLLTDARDVFGLRRVALDWRLLPIDLFTIRSTATAAAEFLVRTGLGRMRVDPVLWDRDTDLPLLPSSHHMGTTRMSATPATGVVDANSRVHGSANLFVAGSSVFPTSSHATPTFTIVQLALRLGAHLLDPAHRRDPQAP